MLNKQMSRERLLYIFVIGVLCVFSLYFAFEIRFEFEPPERYLQARIEMLFWYVPLKLVILYSFGMFDTLFVRLRTYDLYRLTAALGVHLVFILYLWYVFSGQDVPPRSVVLIDFMLSLLVIGGFRALIQFLRGEAFGITEGGSQAIRNVLIVGAGFVGASIARSLIARRGYGKRPLAFLDDDLSKLGQSVGGVRVVGNIRSLKHQVIRFDIDEVILAMPAAPQMLVRYLVAQSMEQGFDLRIVPSPQEMINGVVVPHQLRPIRVEDLIGRDVLETDALAIYELISGKVVMVTGAGGTIGSELCRQIAAHSPNRIILVEQSEIQLFTITEELETRGYSSAIVPLVADIAEEGRMDYILDHFRPDVFFHAAAHKHVPLMESQPSEAIKNNSLATARLARLACRYQVSNFVLISTDKAIRPTSVMGASKRLAELAVQAVQVQPGNRTRFISVRFGNVLGSSGSVVPVFERQIQRGGPITVTHPEMTRYFMTIHEAVGLVLQSATMGDGGEVFVLDMGKPIRILEIANLLIELHGLKPEADIEIKFTGLRPGEKLFEELRHSEEESSRTRHPQVNAMRAGLPGQEQAEDLFAFLEDLARDAYNYERNKIKQIMRERIPDYKPFMD